MRHGQTADNKKHLLQGRKNIPLSDEGVEQAMQAKADLDAEGIRFDRVCASPLKRAMQTASLITGVDESDIEPIEEIIEYDFGPLEGKRVEDLGENMRAFFMDPEAYIAPEGAETYDEMFERVEEYLKRMEKDSKMHVQIDVYSDGDESSVYNQFRASNRRESIHDYIEQKDATLLQRISITHHSQVSPLEPDHEWSRAGIIQIENN